MADFEFKINHKQAPGEDYFRRQEHSLQAEGREVLDPKQNPLDGPQARAELRSKQDQAQQPATPPEAPVAEQPAPQPPAPEQPAAQPPPPHCRLYRRPHDPTVTPPLPAGAALIPDPSRALLATVLILLLLCVLAPPPPCDCPTAGAG